MWCETLGWLVKISIHALHEESDIPCAVVDLVERISIHALHEESDADVAYIQIMLMIFQSTLSMRRATYSRTR